MKAQQHWSISLRSRLGTRRLAHNTLRRAHAHASPCCVAQKEYSGPHNVKDQDGQQRADKD